MRQYHGLTPFIAQCERLPTLHALAVWLALDLQQATGVIEGQDIEGKPVILALLQSQSDSWLYDPFDQRIDFSLVGQITCNDRPPLTYRVQGVVFGFSGRCSVLPQVCGVDLYLHSNYSQQIGETVRQRFSLSLKPLLKLAVG